MTNFDGKISAIFMNIATDTDSNESYKYFKDSIKYLMEEYAKEILEAFIDDHFPENSKDCKTALFAKIGNLKPGEYFSFEASINNDIKRNELGFPIFKIPRNPIESWEVVDIRSKSDAKEKPKIGQTVYALQNNEINKYKIIETDNTELYPIVVKDDDDNIEVYPEEDVFETVEALLNDLRNKANDL